MQSTQAVQYRDRGRALWEFIIFRCPGFESWRSQGDSRNWGCDANNDKQNARHNDCPGNSQAHGLRPKEQGPDVSHRPQNERVNQGSYRRSVMWKESDWQHHSGEGNPRSQQEKSHGFRKIWKVCPDGQCQQQDQKRYRQHRSEIEKPEDKNPEEGALQRMLYGELEDSQQISLLIIQ